MNRIIKVFYKETAGVHRAAYLLGSFAFLSQILGLLRDRLLAHYFGASAGLDVYYAAFEIPDLIFLTIGSVVAFSVIIPFLTERKENKEREQKFLNDIFTFFIIVILIVCVIAFIALPFIIPLIFKGFSFSQIQETVLLSRFLLLSPIFLGISNLFSSVNQVYQRYISYGLSPLVYNLAIILGIAIFSPIWGIRGVVMGLVIGTVLHMAFQLPFILKLGLVPRFDFDINWKEIWKVVKTTIPRTITLSFSSLTVTVFLAFASFMPEGSIAVFNLASNVQAIPLSVIGISYALAAFSLLSKLHNDRNHEEFKARLASSMKHIIFWTVPALVLFIVLRAQIVKVALGSGQFNWNDTRLTAGALAIFSISLLFQSLVNLFVRAFYARGNTKTPLFSGLFSSVLSVILGYLFFMHWNEGSLAVSFLQSILKVSDLKGTVIFSLPLAVSIGSFVNFIILWFCMKFELKTFNLQIGKSFRYTLWASIVMGAVVKRILDFFPNVVNDRTVLGVFTQGLFSGVIGMIVFFVVLYILGSEELKEIFLTINKKLFKEKVILPDNKII